MSYASHTVGIVSLPPIPHGRRLQASAFTRPLNGSNGSERLEQGAVPAFVHTHVSCIGQRPKYPIALVRRYVCARNIQK